MGWHMSRIFVSHSSRNTREAVALKRWLVEQDPPLANEIFLDVDPDTGLRTGTRWKDALRQANARCEAVICLLSSDWEASSECRVEYRTAENLNKQIFVARLEPSTGESLTSEWQRCDLFPAGPTTTIDLGDGAPVQMSTEGLYRLRDGVRGAGIGAESFVWPPLADPDRAPYRGWQSLEEADAAVFFGRDTQIVRALDAVRGMRLGGLESMFVILGPSGTGKSSFLRAGLLPRLRREDRRFVICDLIRPQRSALTGQAGLAVAIAGVRRRFGLAAPNLGEIKDACSAGDADQIAMWLEQVRVAAGDRLLERGADAEAATAPTLVLPLDQAEELFSADSGEQATAFLQLLASVIDRLGTAETALVVVATIRTDRYEVMQTHPALAGVGTVLFDELKPMPSTQFKEVIVGPAQRATEGGRPLRLAPDLVDRLLEDTGEGADTLPMLALTMSRLYTDYGASGELRLSHYEALGGLRRVVQNEIDEVLSSDPGRREAELTSLRSAFIPWLATINPDNDQPMRRVARWADLPEPSRPLVDALVSKRLMVKDIRDGQTVTEVALESLLRQWDDLAGWLREQRKDLKNADDLLRSASAWDVNGRNPAWLLEGTRLTEATELVNRPGFGQRLAVTHAFLTASYQREASRRAAEEQQRQAEILAAQERTQHALERQATAEAHTAVLRRRSRVLRAVLAGTAMVAVIAVVLSFVANAARNQAQDRFVEATAVRLVSESQAMLANSRPGGTTRAIQQLLAAGLLTQRYDRGVLYDAVAQLAPVSKIRNVPRPVVSPVFSPDGKWVAAGDMTSQDGVARVRIWDAETGELHGDPLIAGSRGFESVDFSPDGRLLASASLDGTVGVFDVATGEPVSEPLAVGKEAHDAVFSRDSARLASLNRDGDLQVWDIESGKPDPKPLLTGARRVSFSADRRRVAASDFEGAVRIFDLRTGKLITDIPAHGELSYLGLSPDGTELLTASFSGALDVWNADTGRLAESLAESSTTVVTFGAFSPDSSVIATGSVDSTVALWAFRHGAWVRIPLAGPAGLISGVAFSPEGDRLAVSGSDGSLWFYDVTTALPLSGSSVEFGSDGTLATGDRNGKILLWDPVTHDISASVGTATEAIVGMAFRRDQTELVTLSESIGLDLWSVADGRWRAAPIKIDTLFRSVAFSADGDLIAAGENHGGVRIVDAKTRRPLIGTLSDGAGRIQAVGFSPNGDTIAALDTENDQLKRWDRNTGKLISVKDLGVTAWVGAVGPDLEAGAGGIDGYVAFYDSASGDPLREPVRGHNGQVTSMAFAAETERAVTSAVDSVRLWDASTGDPIGQPVTGPREALIDVAISPDSRFLAVATKGDNVWIWPAWAEPADLCAKLAANMSRKQWDQWVSPDIPYRKVCDGLPIAPD
ncbi:TIR domain-containing protein [Mycobacterium sp. CVI_P3]|uniref:TIR domain-containing protein n=1 Tax=Mycobacterium pinniadriaticum TaxID=2994102 RepID=A0ABT3SKU8_9MYCO|nr:TIR domain-containing protein [Mycobacterium pinniadriaticum]MCX2933722.1 TIR domain-containing protein [Mycobacterium pinniadriaticum]MCX2940144.1 TIR domain-containing protein [Mycobacterium pinniadriaticum]